MDHSNFVVCLCDFILYIPVISFSVMLERVFLGCTSTKHGLMCLAQGHNTVLQVRLDPATPQSLVKLSTTEPLRSLNFVVSNCMRNCIDENVNPYQGCILAGISFLSISSILLPTRKSGIRRDKYLSAAIFKEAVHSDDS